MSFHHFQSALTPHFLSAMRHAARGFTPFFQPRRKSRKRANTVSLTEHYNFANHNHSRYSLQQSSDTQNELTLIATIILIIYILLGGLIFRELEHGAEHERCTAVNNEFQEEFGKTLERIKKSGSMLGSADNSNQSSIRIFLENFAQMAHLFAEINAHDAVLKVEIVSESNSSEQSRP